MDSAAYKLWDRIKKQMKETGNETGIISLDGTDSGVRMVNQLRNAGFIEVLYVDRYKLEYRLFHYKHD